MTKKNVLFAAAAIFFVMPATMFAQQQAPVALSGADNEYQVGATLYMQKAAEFRALAYQAFNLARLRLDEDLNGRNQRKLPRSERKRPRAVIVDIDETVLDNSPAQAAGIRDRRSFNMKDWYAWTEMRSARAIPGAVEFLNYAVARGIKVFYISNRDEVQKQATIENLRAVGFRDAGMDNVLLRQKDEKGANISTKTPRRSFVGEKYRIVLLLGDNLDDFADIFERRSIAERFLETDRSKDEWGRRWIVLPNAMYGTWENAIYEYKAGELTEAQKAEMRMKALDMP